MSQDQTKKRVELGELATIGRYRNLPLPVKVLFLTLTTTGVALFIYHVFGFSIADFVFVEHAYYYLLTGLFGGSAFLILPVRRGDRSGKVPWYDWLMAGALFAMCFYWFLNGYEIANIGWSPPTPLQLALAAIFCLIALEGSRRMAGNAFITVCIIVGLYPLITDRMPGLLWGYSPPFNKVIASYVYGRQGLIGLPAEVVFNILIGFLLFAAVLLMSGAGQFFLDMAIGLLGRFRGGPAKVSVVGSAFFGTMSGSPYANVIATGCFTIPAMKRTGYPPHYAGAIEACASTGGVIMPPVMGSIAFVMCILLGVSYGYVCAAAFIPAFLYYLGLLLQVDAYAARAGLKGMAREEIPSLWRTFKQGWHYLLAVAFLAFAILYMRWAELSPLYASGLLFILSFVRKETWMTPRKIVDVLASTGNMTAQTMAILLPVGLLLGGLSITGIAGAFTVAVTTLGGESVVLLMAIAIITVYLMGMVGMAIIAYIVLSVTLAPSLIQLLNAPPIAVHLFLVYYTIMGGLTAPVAPVAFFAAALAGASPMRTSLTAMRLAVVIYFIPIYFLMNPALVLQGTALEILYAFVVCSIGVLLLAAGLEGYLLRMGVCQIPERVLLVAAGLVIAFPSWPMTLGGVALAAVAIVVCSFWPRRGRHPPPRGGRI